MKNFIKNIFLGILILIILFGIAPLFINWLINTPNPFGWGFVNDSNKDTWINFFGAVLGGGITLFGVWLTIKSEDKKRRKDMINSQRPFLKITLHNKANDDYYSVVPAKAKMFISYYTKEDDDKYVIPAYKVSLKLENIGLGIAESIHFETISYEFFNYGKDQKKTTFSYKIEFENLYDYPYIQKNDFEIIPILFRINESNKSKMYNGLIQSFKKCQLHYEGNIHFCDCFNNSFIQKMILEADVFHNTSNNTLSFKATKLYLENIESIASLNKKINQDNFD